jgi:hypothetical protein
VAEVGERAGVAADQAKGVGKSEESPESAGNPRVFGSKLEIGQGRPKGGKRTAKEAKGR